MKLFSIVGARPQFVKLAPLSKLLSDKHDEWIVHTGQHYDYAMSEMIFEDLGIRKPDIHLGIGSGSHASQTGQMMAALEGHMIEKKPQLVIVFGDTNSTLAGALAASKLGIPLLHIEAGLRSFNRQMPEEINRVVTDHIADHLFAPTPSAVELLNAEGLSAVTKLTGDIMVDTLVNSLQIALKKSNIIQRLKLTSGEFNLLTLHRNYTVDQPEILEHILKQLETLNEKIVFPVHPRTKKILDSIGINNSRMIFTEPQGYLDFIVLEYAAKRIITDSGGIQKEAYILKKPCITLRTETEWIETVHEGWNLLIEPTDKAIAQRIAHFEVPEHQTGIFGEEVAQKMVSLINAME